MDDVSSRNWTLIVCNHYFDPFLAQSLTLLLSFSDMLDQVITFRARIHTIRRMSAKLAFIVLRQQTVTIQGVLEVSAENDPG